MLRDAGHYYESEGALWLRTTDFGDDKDRVMRKSDGSYTYFVPDVAYHLDKFRRGFAHVVNVQGADHHSTVTRVRAGLQALDAGIPKGYPDYVLHQMVTVMQGRRGGEDLQARRQLRRRCATWSTRWAATRCATSSSCAAWNRTSCSTSTSPRASRDDNPVYYVQYAHARMCSVLREWGGDAAALAGADLAPLGSPYEVALAQKLAEFPELLARAAGEFAPHLLTHYLHDDVAARLHTYYNAERFLVEDERVEARPPGARRRDATGARQRPRRPRRERSRKDVMPKDYKDAPSPRSDGKLEPPACCSA